KRSWSLPKALIGSPAPPLPQRRPGEESWPRKTRKEADDSSRAFLTQTAAASRKVEKNESARRAPNPRGASQDHAASRSSDRSLCRTQRGDGSRSRGTRQDHGSGNRRAPGRKG